MTTRVLGARGRVSSLQDGQVEVMAGTAYADVLRSKKKAGSKLDPRSSAEAGVRGARQRVCLTKKEAFYWCRVDPRWPAAAPGAAAKKPNLLVVLFSDVGFSDFGCYGSTIRTPTIDALVARGVRMTGFHTTAMCSTTRCADAPAALFFRDCRPPQPLARRLEGGGLPPTHPAGLSMPKSGRCTRCTRWTPTLPRPTTKPHNSQSGRAAWSICGGAKPNAARCCRWTTALPTAPAACRVHATAS